RGLALSHHDPAGPRLSPPRLGEAHLHAATLVRARRPAARRPQPGGRARAQGRAARAADAADEDGGGAADGVRSVRDRGAVGRRDRAHPGHSAEHGLDAVAPRAPRVLRARREVSEDARGKARRAARGGGGGSAAEGTRDGDEEMSGRDDDRSAPADAAEPQRLIEDAGLYGYAHECSWALGLLRRAEPYRTPAGRKQRVQLRLGHRARRRAPLVFLRFAVAACVLLGGAAIVSAAIGHWPTWVPRAYAGAGGQRRAES